MWRGSKTQGGYGRFGNSVKFGTNVAHRISYIIHVGQIPPGLLVCHKCDNPPCVRPDHLFLGTAKDNNIDMFQKGRANKLKGSAHWKTSLTEKQVLEIRQKYKPRKYSSYRLGVEYGISQQTAHLIATKKTWRHVK